MNYTRHFECGCKIMVIGELTNAEIHYCPKHKAAPKMYKALKAWDELQNMRPLDSGSDIDALLRKIARLTDEALAEAESK